MTDNLETTLSAFSLFDKLDPEKRVEIIKPKIKRNETLDLIIEKYKEGLENFGLYRKGKLKIEVLADERGEYYTAKSSAPSKTSSDNITEFSLLLEEHENKKYFESFTGFYFNALINSSKEQDFKIITNYLSKTIHFIGYKNTKNIVVNGNAGQWVGSYMKDGEITINGNAGDWVGSYMKDGKITINGNAGWGVGGGMEDGKITVNGNVEDWVGWNMKNGEITIKGNAGWGVGCRMKDGEIHLCGDYKGLDRYIPGGNIYHKRKLIVENGEKLI